MRKLLCLFIGGLLLWPAIIQAQTPPASPTLAAGLREARAPEGGLALAVGAETVTPPAGGVAPAPGASVAETAAAFGLTTRAFGGVTAVAPATMTVLNTSPGTPNPFAEMTPFASLPLLAASLSDAQWQALTGARGLGLSDLTDDTQRTLFLAQFRDGTLKIAPRRTDGKAPAPGEVRDLTAQIPQVRLRLGQSAQVRPSSRDLEDPEGPYLIASMPDPPGGPPTYRLYSERRPPRETLHGVPVRAEVPNTPKKSALDFDAAPLQAPVPLEGLKTVGELVFRIGRLTHLELYADRHYAAKPLTFIGPVGAATARDLLRALAFCLTATYRQVGPAFVLTDDLAGVGTRRQVLAEFDAQSNALQFRASETARGHLFETRSARALSWFGDPLVPTPAEQTPDASDVRGRMFPELPPDEKRLPLSALTPAQQAAARRFADDYARNHADEIAQDPKRAPDLSAPVLLETSTTLQMLAPGVETPIDTGSGTLLFSPPQDVAAQRMAQEDARKQAAKATQPAPPSLATLLKPLARRAVLARPRDAAEVKMLVATMRQLGLNELWLDVFSDGTPTPEAVVTEALTEAHRAGLTVWASLDLLTWGPTAPKEVADLNRLGETSAQMTDRRHRQEIAAAPDPQHPPGPFPPARTSVSPFAPGVTQTLADVVHDVSAHAEIAGLVWRDTTPEGYSAPTEAEAAYGRNDADDLGYTPAARLAFLRRYGADSLDISPRMNPRINTRLPNFDDARTDAELLGTWRQFRAASVTALLRTLTQAPSRPLPILTARTPYAFEGEQASNPGTRHVSLERLSIQDAADDKLTEEIQDAAKRAATGGVVLDLTDTSQSGVALLRRLAAPPGT